MPHFDPQTLELVTTAVVGATLLLQVILLFAILFGIRKAAIAIRSDIDQIRSTITPLIGETRDLMSRVGPKIDDAADDLAALTHVLRQQTEGIQNTVAEINNRARKQVGRVDLMVTSLLDTTERAGAVVNDAVAKPMRQLAGAVAWLRAVVESLRTPGAPEPKPPVDGAEGGPGMFI